MFYEDKSSGFDRSVARYHPAVYTFTSRSLRSDRANARLIQQRAQRSKNLRNQTAIATVLILAGHTCGISSGSGEQLKKLKADGYPFFHIDSEFSEFSCTA